MSTRNDGTCSDCGELSPVRFGSRCMDCHDDYQQETIDSLRSQLNDEQQRSAHRYQTIQRQKAQERILLDWQKDACKVLETASCECDEYQGFHCLRCRLLGEVHPDQREGA